MWTHETYRAIIKSNVCKYEWNIKLTKPDAAKKMQSDILMKMYLCDKLSMCKYEWNIKLTKPDAAKMMQSDILMKMYLCDKLSMCFLINV